MINGIALMELCESLELAKDWMEEVTALSSMNLPEFSQILEDSSNFWWECVVLSGPKWLDNYHKRNDF